MFGGHEEGEGQNFDLISGAGSLVKQKSNTKQASKELLIFQGHYYFRDCCSCSPCELSGRKDDLISSSLVWKENKLASIEAMLV